MLLEAVRYLITPCSPDVRKLGYLKELIATEARARRCRDAWRTHQERTKSLIRGAISETKGRDHAVVLGGGLILDIPLEELANSFRQIDLVDVCFSRRTRAAARKFPNVTLLELDLTGVVGPLTSTVGQIEVGSQADPERQKAIERLQSADLVVSANTLSQLPLIPLAVIRRRDEGQGGVQMDRLAPSLIQDHLKLLDSCHGTVCLVTELERLTYRDGVAIDQESALYGLALDLPGEGWVWDIAPAPEFFPDCDVRLRVGSAVWRNEPPKPGPMFLQAT